MKANTLLKCEIRRGLFLDERVVVVHGADGETESFFVPRSAVDEVRSAIRVLVGNEDGAGRVVASLHTADGRAEVLVRRADLLVA